MVFLSTLCPWVTLHAQYFYGSRNLSLTLQTHREQNPTEQVQDEGGVCFWETEIKMEISTDISVSNVFIRCLLHFAWGSENILQGDLSVKATLTRQSHWL